MSGQKLPTPVKGVVEQDVNEGMLLLRETGEYLLLNKMGARIWRELNSTDSLSELVTKLSTILNAPEPGELKKQASQFIEKIVDAGFVEERF